MILKKIIAFILFFLSFLFFLFFFLINGIKIDSFSFGGFSVSQFYIKIDKKLIVEIDEIVLKAKESSSDNSIEDVKSLLNKAPSVLKFFERIDIEKLKIKDNTFKIKFDNDHIYLDNKFLNISSKYFTKGDVLHLNIYSVYLKDLDFLLLGKLKLDYANNMLNFFGEYMYKESAIGELNFQANKKELDFFINSKEMKNLKFLRSYLDVDPIANAWIYDNIKGKYFLDYLYGKIDLENFTPVLNSIKGYARVEDAQIRFDKKLDVVKTPLINLEYKNDNLLITLKKPSYKGISIDGSFVNIKDMTSLKHGHVDVTLKANHMLDDKVLGILKAYDINLPLKQISGKTQADVHLYIPYDSSMKTFGVFNSKDAIFKINDFEFYSKKGSVDLINSSVIIKNTNFVHKDLVNAQVDLKINTNTLKSSGKAFLNSFEVVNEKEEIVSVKNKKVNISLNFDKTTKLSIDDFKADIFFFDEYTNIKIGSLEKVFPYSKLLQEIDIKSGDLSINLYDVDNLSFIANLDKLNTPLIKDEKKVEKLKLFGKIDNKGTSLNTSSNDLKIDIVNKKVNIVVNSYDIDLKDEEKKEQKFKNELNIRLLDSNILLSENSYYSQDSKINILEDNIYFDGIFSKLDLPIQINSKKVHSLDINGSIKKGIISLETKDKSLSLVSKKDDEISLKLKDVDLLYDTSKTSNTKYKSLKIEAQDSNIIINNKYKVISNSFLIDSNTHMTNFNLKYKDGIIKYLKSKNEEINLDVAFIDDTFINTFFDEEILKGGKINLKASGKDDYISGRMDFDKNRIMNLAVLNNLITLVNTTPALINPLLAVPTVFGMVTEEGFNLNGYSVNEGYTDFTYNFDTRFLNLIKIHTVGNSVDFDGYGTIDLENSLVDAKIELVFMKNYSKIVNFIPGLNYIFLGDDKRISTAVDIKGDLNDPKIESNIAKDSVSVPYNILKRIITSPFKLFETKEE